MKVKVLNTQTQVEIREMNLADSIDRNGECLLGRSPHSGLILDSPDVSRLHGKFSVENGQYYFYDLGSSNGSLVNGQIVQPNQGHLLKPGDIIRLGEFVLMLQAISEHPEDLAATVIGDPNATVIGMTPNRSWFSTKEAEPALAVANEQVAQLPEVEQVAVVQTFEVQEDIPAEEQEEEFVLPVETDFSEDDNAALVADDLVVDELVTDEPEINEPEINEPVVNEPVAVASVVNEPAIDEPAIEESVVNELAIDDLAIDESVINEPAIDESVINEPAIDDLAIDDLAIDEPVVDDQFVQSNAIEELEAVELETLEEAELTEAVQDEELGELEQEDSEQAEALGLPWTESLPEETEATEDPVSLEPLEMPSSELAEADLDAELDEIQSLEQSQVSDWAEPVDHISDQQMLEEEVEPEASYEATVIQLEPDFSSVEESDRPMSESDDLVEPEESNNLAEFVAISESTFIQPADLDESIETTGSVSELSSEPILGEDDEIENEEVVAAIDEADYWADGTVVQLSEPIGMVGFSTTTAEFSEPTVIQPDESELPELEDNDYLSAAQVEYTPDLSEANDISEASENEELENLEETEDIGSESGFVEISGEEGVVENTLGTVVPTPEDDRISEDDQSVEPSESFTEPVVNTEMQSIDEIDETEELDEVTGLSLEDEVTGLSVEEIQALDAEALLDQIASEAVEAALMEVAEPTSTVSEEAYGAEPDLEEPEIIESELEESELEEPEIAELDLEELELAESELTESKLEEPEIAESEITEPEVAEEATVVPDLAHHVPDIVEVSATYPDKYIALLAHDEQKSELVNFVARHQDFLSHCLTVATPSVSEILKRDLGFEVSQQTPAVPPGGYQTVNSLITSDKMLAVIFLRDFFTPQTTQANDEAFSRSCNIHQVMFASNLPTAEAIVSAIRTTVATPQP